jgi:hypothetical protein
MPLALERETASTGGGMGASRARSERGESSGAGATLAVCVALANGAAAAAVEAAEEEEVADEEDEGAGERGDEKFACGGLGAAAGAGDANDDEDEDEDDEDDDGARRSVRCRIDDADASVAKMSLVEVRAAAPAGGAAVAGVRLLQSTGDRKEARDETILHGKCEQFVFSTYAALSDAPRKAGPRISASAAISVISSSTPGLATYKPKHEGIDRGKDTNR